jgi:hypothetical protein
MAAVEPTAAEIEAAARIIAELPELVDDVDHENAASDALTAALPLVEARLREQIEHGAAVAAERHIADTERGGCSCGFCVWSVEHVVIMAIREAA